MDIDALRDVVEEENVDIFSLYHPRIWSEEDKADWIGELAETNPSDLVVVGNELGITLLKVLKDSGVWEGIGIPSDIFESGTIPIQDCLIRYTDVEMTLRVTAIDDHGYLTVQYDNSRDFRIIFPFIHVEDEVLGSKICIDPLNVMCNGENLLRQVLDNNAKRSSGLYVLFDDMLKHWYSIQVLLLNPDIKEIMLKKDGKEKVSGVCYIPKKEKGRKAHYVKRHYIKEDILDMQVGEGIERHTLCWYVIGHWRNYRNGKKSFVKGYWKGPLRHMERNMDEGRVRDI